MIFAEQNELFPVERRPGCLRLDLVACLGPCAAACTRGAYREQVRAAEAFLAGRERTLLDDLEAQMIQAAGAMQFERAAVLRDRIEPLLWLDRCLARLRSAEELSLVYPITSSRGGELWYVLRRGRIVAVLEAPQSGRGEGVAEQLEQLTRQKETGALSLEEVDLVLLVDSWFRRHPGERARCWTPEEAITRCRARVETPT
jgi:excinuclease ABC subunit C